MTTNKSHGERVKAAILAEGLTLWRIDPTFVSARRIGQRLKMTHGNVLYHFTNAQGLRDAVASEAVRIGDKKIVPQLITAKHPAVADLPGADKDRYLAGC